ncbi:aminotransferase class I/II-fold pyridoxal phosphate-dependent enzyme [Bacillus sp. FJAT-27445]|uniref:aminotransferase class I/II-fold pyridoxal phosphate-dependent enzyme n=1 Tax=Bacillus sp. FJAT-27445 TaxID=1679166 RepID=UPI000743510C|nr:aminotransferase class I/II-fold pyridoxal phosphate-dependent enzyme [Bacillus sp. FJAT-27445]
MNQLNVPLLNALTAHISTKPVSFHVPGHKYGTVLDGEAAVYFSEIMKLDATELSGLDDLHSPEGAIHEAAQLLAELYGVEESFFLVNGSTVGNLAMIASVCGEGDKILVQRNCHKSIINGIRLAKAEPIFIEPVFNGEWKVACGLDVPAVHKALACYPELKAIVLTYPNYYGIADPIGDIISAAHLKGIPVLVDEAHGAHFIAGAPFPQSAVELGADIVVQSAHKTLPAMTMGSFLHFNSKLVELTRLKDYLQMLQSSSPSYPIMASLDLARNFLGTINKRDLKNLLEHINRFRGELADIPQIRVLENEGKADPLKVVIQAACGLNGYEIQKLLEHQGIFTELADPHNILLILPLLKEGMDYPFKNAARKIAEALAHYPAVSPTPLESSSGGCLSGLALSLNEMDGLPCEVIELTKAVGLISAETIIPYPPGIPVILKGERITKRMASRLAELKKSGSRFQGGQRLTAGEILIYRKG